jgi:hypothetical protein
MGNEDNTLDQNPAEADHIDTGSEEALQRWAKRLDVSPDQIRDAVAKVGSLASDVELHLKGSRSTTNDDRMDDASEGQRP